MRLQYIAIAGAVLVALIVALVWSGYQMGVNNGKSKEREKIALQISEAVKAARVKDAETIKEWQARDKDWQARLEQFRERDDEASIEWGADCIPAGELSRMRAATGAVSTNTCGLSDGM